MKTETVYVQVNCSERLPTKIGVYFTNLGQIERFSDAWIVDNPFQEIDWWLEKREDVIVMSKEELDKILSEAIAWSYYNVDPKINGLNAFVEGFKSQNDMLCKS